MLTVKDPLKRAMLSDKEAHFCGSLLLCGHKKAQRSPGEFKGPSIYWVDKLGRFTGQSSYDAHARIHRQRRFGPFHDLSPWFLFEASGTPVGGGGWGGGH